MPSQLEMSNFGVSSRKSSGADLGSTLHIDYVAFDRQKSENHVDLHKTLVEGACEKTEAEIYEIAVQLIHDGKRGSRQLIHASKPPLHCQQTLTSVWFEVNIGRQNRFKTAGRQLDQGLGDLVHDGIDDAHEHGRQLAYQQHWCGGRVGQARWI